ncbi:ATP-dependent nuclease [Agaribacterium haliotis]|uniref:ATP-dependent nuclease n=1 Tax=Agaribacterium haliotis TaxID=2013869 RepID=UPI000BB571B8|nr:AAA family ATPase [Agaribacterium haliotis]
MYIRSVEIENYRAFKDFRIELSSLSLIIGENEAGKTNLFDALALPLNSNDISFNKKRLSVSDINRKAISEFYQAIIDGKTDEEIKALIPKVRIEIEFTDPKGEFQKQVISKWICGDIADSSHRIKYESAPKDEDDFITVVKQTLDGITNIDDSHWFTLPVDLYDYAITSINNGKKIGYNDLKHIAINSINADRDDFAESQTQKSNDILTKMLVSSLSATEKTDINNAYISFFEAIEDTKTFEKIVKPEPDFENFFDHLDQNECIPNLPNLKSILSNITLQSGDSYLYQRGLGYRNLVYIFLLFEFFKSSDLQFNLCCIEEPEAHLSVNNLRVATDFIYKSATANQEDGKLQTLISSHNPQVINKLQLSNVIVVSGDNAIHLNDVDDDLTNYLRKRPNFDILKLLFSDRTILVEGTTEEMLINSILSSDEENLHRVEVISIGQKGFRTFMDIWLQINKDNDKKRLGIIRDFDNQQGAKDDHDAYDAAHNNIRVRTTVAYTLENDLVAASANLANLKRVFEGHDDDDIDEMSQHLIDNKAETMLEICDAILKVGKEEGEEEEELIEIVLPPHIQEVVDFMTND